MPTVTRSATPPYMGSTRELEVLLRLARGAIVQRIAKDGLDRGHLYASALFGLGAPQSAGENRNLQRLEL